MGVGLLRCSVLRETPMASAIHFKQLKCYEIPEWLRSKKTGRFPPEHLDALSRNKWTLSPKCEAFGSRYNRIEH